MKPSKWFPFNMIGDVISFFRRTLSLVKHNIQSSIRLQLIATFLVCLLASLLVYKISYVFIARTDRQPVIDYNMSTQSLNSNARNIAEILNNSGSSSNGGQAPTAEFIQNLLNQRTQFNHFHILLVDFAGKVLYKSANATETQVDLSHLMTNAMDTDLDRTNPYKVTRVYPVTIKGQQVQEMFLVLSGAAEPTIMYINGSSPLPSLLAIAAFILLFYWLTKRKMRQIEELAEGLLEISKGNLDYRVEQKSQDELGSLAGNINHMTVELQRTIEEERNAERTKNELITNVSHDLRTPLTLIMGYLRLLKDKNYEDMQQAESYLNIAFNKSEKLKGLIEHLFEYTRYVNHGVKLREETICLNELLEQLIEESVTFAEENELTFIRNLTQEKLMVVIDADKIIRVFENLLANAIKYSHKPGQVTIRLIRQAQYAQVCIANRGDAISSDELSKLFDRFYRVDAARSSSTGGAGLGLAIAKSIVESHNGEIWAESDEQEIRFCVRLKLAEL